jgi:glycosyltransferase involved in cell wall biosynthesis
MRILVVTRELPKPDQNGGDGRLCWLLRILAKRNRVMLYPYTAVEDASELVRYRSALRSDGVRVLRGDWLSGLENALTDQVFDVVLFELWASAEVGIEPVRRLQPWARIIVDSVDLHFRREDAEAALGLLDPALAADRKHRELAVYRGADAVVCVSDEDGRLLDAEVDSVRRFTVSNVATPRSRSMTRRDPELLFLGGFRHAPNRDGLLWFLDSIWPAVCAAVPTARLSVVGSHLPDDLRLQIQAAGVVPVGYVPDPALFLDRAALMVAPLRYGAGVKNKVTEAMASGLAVVTTSVGAQGLGAIPGTHLEIADEPAAFARRVVDLLGDADRAERIGRAARDHIAGICFPEVIEPRLGALLDAVVTGKRVTIPPRDWYRSRVLHLARRARACLGRVRRRVLRGRLVQALLPIHAYPSVKAEAR